jgi:diguanylate cyclase (GGDEF)-like protein
MASEPTPTPSAEPAAPAAPVLLDPAVKRGWLRATRVTVVLTVVFCLLLTGLRWLDAQRQARAVGAAVVNLVDAAQGVTSVTQPVVAAAVEPQVSVQSVAHCPANTPGQCETLFAREGAQACATGFSLTTLCAAVPSLSRPEDTVRVGFALGATWLAAAEQAVACLVLMVGVLLAFARVRTSRASSATSQASAPAEGAAPGGGPKSNERDALTGLLNRVAFEAALKRHNEAENLSALEVDGCLMYFDLDRFKLINDTYGHIAGDTVLRTVSQRLRYTLGGGVLIGRLGGDEFAALITDVSSKGNIETICRVLIEQVSKPIPIDDVKEWVGLSIGAYMIKRGTLTVGEMLHRADLAMYEAKRAGRGRLVFYHESMEDSARSRAQIQGELKQAIDARQFFLVYQPQFDGKDQIRGVEAMVRWRHPVRGLIPPDEFMSIAEQSGLIVPLGKHVIGLVCEDLVNLRKEGLVLPYVSLDVSMRQLADKALVEDLQETLQRHGLTAADLEFEVTEGTTMVGQVSKENATLRQLQDMRFRIAIDGFGAGQSSLARLIDLKVDKIKIDPMFVRAIGQPGFNPALLELMISLAQRLDVKIVAQGVSKLEQVSWLKQAGCPMMQGDFFAHPMTHVQLLTWLREQAGERGYLGGVWAPTRAFADSDAIQA